MKHRGWGAAWLAAVAVAGCASAGFERIDVHLLGPAPEADAEYLLDEHVVRVLPQRSGPPEVEESRHVQVRILTEAGRGHAYAVSYYDSERSRPGTFRVTVSFPDGHVRHFGPADATDGPAYSDSVLYGSRRRRALFLHDLPLGPSSSTSTRSRGRTRRSARSRTRSGVARPRRRAVSRSSRRAGSSSSR